MSCTGTVGVLHEWRWECWENSRVASRVSRTFRGSRGKLGFLSRCCSGKGPHLALRGESPCFLKLRQETWGSSRVKTGTSGTNSCGLWKVQSPCELQGASRYSSPVFARAYVLIGDEAGTSGFLSSADMDLGVPMEFLQRSQASSHVETCKSAILLRWISTVMLL